VESGILRHVLTAFVIACAGSAFAAPPERVVSMHLCTDQLALMLAAPGQLVSVSDWAARPGASNLAKEAARLPLNGASAEQIFQMQPDLVLAGAFSNPATVDLLRRLGIRVESFPVARSMSDVSATLRRLGALLGRTEAAEALVADFEAALSDEGERARALPSEAAAYHYANNYTSGADTLAGEVMARAGFENAAARLGLSGVSQVALETLVMARPFLIRTEAISGTATGRSYESMRHPALAALAEGGRSATVAERWQTCGTPFVVKAVAALIDARLAGSDTLGGGRE
jgi:iron complex transport system substrate-binding protein